MHPLPLIAMSLLSLPTITASPSAPSARSQLRSVEARIVVTVYPDLTGLGESDGCPGCDGRLGADDLVAGNRTALPALELMLRDAEGRPIQRQRTRPQSNGRQVAVFRQRPVEGLSLGLVGLPEGWLACPDRPLWRDLEMDAGTGELRVDFGLWQGCPTQSSRASAGAAALGPGASRVSDGAGAELPAAAEEVPALATSEAGAVVKGHVFVDPDRDGPHGENGVDLGAWPVMLQGEHASWTAWTDAGGRFGFFGLPAGRYALQLDAPAGYRVLTTDRYAQLVLEPAAAKEIAFGVRASAPASAARGEPKPARRQASPSRLPGTGARTPSHGPLAFGVAALLSFIGMLGLVLDAGTGQHN